MCDLHMLFIYLFLLLLWVGGWVGRVSYLEVRSFVVRRKSHAPMEWGALPVGTSSSRLGVLGMECSG